jgi:glycosyltransferase involved in cell wall biosynthesis
VSVKIAVFPRDPNPYQELLYREMRALGDEVRYVGRLTGSHTLNLLALPAELAVLRARGYRVLHLHWTFGFALPWATGPALRRLSRLWFEVVLLTLACLGYSLVWTAHNVLPHDPVFDDDRAARRRLLAACDLVIAHSPDALRELSEIGALPAATAVVPHGPMSAPGLEALAPPRALQPRTVLFVGRITRYKGIEDLLAALRELDSPVRVVVAGACEDPELRRDLLAAASALGETVSLQLGFIEEPELVRVLGEADAVVYPFRSVTTSGSLMLGLAAGRPVIVPDLPALRDVSDAAAIRYEPGVAGLRAALDQVARAPQETLRAMGAAARELSDRRSWPEIAARTHELIARLCSAPTAGP